MESPNATKSSVDEIIQTFKGFECPFKERRDQMWFSFNDRSSFENALNLINMLKGWEATAHTDIKNTIKILSA